MPIVVTKDDINTALRNKAYNSILLILMLLIKILISFVVA